MSTETRREIYHTTMEISAPQQDTEPRTVMATVEIAYEEGHQDGYQEGWENCNRDIHDVVAQESYDDGIRQGRALVNTELRDRVIEQQSTIDRLNDEQQILQGYINDMFQKLEKKQPTNCLKRTSTV